MGYLLKIYQIRKEDLRSLDLQIFKITQLRWQVRVFPSSFCYIFCSTSFFLSSQPKIKYLWGKQFFFLMGKVTSVKVPVIPSLPTPPSPQQPQSINLFGMRFASMYQKHHPYSHGREHSGMYTFLPAGAFGKGQMQFVQLEQGDEIFWRFKHLKKNPLKFVKVRNVSYTMMHWHCLVSSAVSLFAQLLSDKTESRHSLFCMHSSSLKNIFIQLLR